MMRTEAVASATPATLSDAPIDPRLIDARFDQFMTGIEARVNRFFARLLLGQWVAMIAVALFVSPLAWEGRVHSIHPHVWAAVLLGGLIAAYPAWLGFRGASGGWTPHVMAVAQMLASSLLIHLTGGRIETHFHIFGSLALLAFYRNVPVLLTASAVVYADHVLRGFFWPESVYGVFVAGPWRSVEHAFWVFFEVFFLSISIRGSRHDMRVAASRQLVIETAKEAMEKIVEERTSALRASEERFRTLFKDAAVGLYHADPLGNVLLANPTMLRILGHDPHDGAASLGLNLRQVGDPEERNALFVELLAKGEIRGRETSWKSRKGTLVHVRESIRAFRDVDGALLYFEGSIEDVTERRNLEERYFQSQKVQAIGQLAGGVAHDFNNILTAILGYADLILEQPKDDEVPAHAVEIRKASERAADLTRQLLAFSRKQTLQPRVFDLNGTVADMDKMLRRLMGENIDIRTRLAADLGLTKADPGQVQQVILNLAVNARDAMPKGGHLTIETGNAHLDEAYLGADAETAPGDFVMIAVSDTGTGMPPEVKARLFEPFFTTKGEGKGTGLGLATCHGIVKQSGGHISVYSEPGIGTTFKVYLPRTREAVDEVETARTPIREGTETILLVEDEEKVRRLAARALTALGYRVMEAGDGVTALALLDGSTLRPDLLVTDVVMPKMGGGVLAERLRERLPGIPIVFTSGYTHDALANLDLAHPGNFFLPKPYSLAELARIVGDSLHVQAEGKNGVVPSKN
ncbi:MAG TPA: ATP-binding protein [Candidatus Methylacidiphilales bacterium]